jgi:riboflavin kinase / FMN adenylyltransferase
MRILRHYRDVPADGRGTIAALGNFDGVHLGHRALLKEAARLAHEEGALFAVFVFEPYPREFFRPQEEAFRLTPFRAKARLLEEVGADVVLVFPFDAELANTSSEAFVLDILVKELSVKHVVVGEDFRYGHKRAGDATTLAYMGEMEGFGVTIIPHLTDASGTKISSSRIRSALLDGHPDEAARLLGHWWSVEADVTEGDKRGRTLGFPTANLKLEGTLPPAFGVYAVRAYIRGLGQPHDGVANYGLRPTFEAPYPLLEVHLFDFVGDLYGQLLRVELISYLRPEQKFSGLEALKAQLVADREAAKAILQHTGAFPALDP